VVDRADPLDACGPEAVSPRTGPGVWQVRGRDEVFQRVHLAADVQRSGARAPDEAGLATYAICLEQFRRFFGRDTLPSRIGTHQHPDDERAEPAEQLRVAEQPLAD